MQAPICHCLKPEILLQYFLLCISFHKYNRICFTVYVSQFFYAWTFCLFIFSHKFPMFQFPAATLQPLWLLIMISNLVQLCPYQFTWLVFKFLGFSVFGLIYVTSMQCYRCYKRPVLIFIFLVSVLPHSCDSMEKSSFDIFRIIMFVFKVLQVQAT